MARGAMRSKQKERAAGATRSKKKAHAGGRGARRNALQVEEKNGRPRRGWEPQRRKRKTPRVPQDHHRRFVAQGDSTRR